MGKIGFCCAGKVEFENEVDPVELKYGTGTGALKQATITQQASNRKQGPSSFPDQPNAQRGGVAQTQALSPKEPRKACVAAIGSEVG